MQLVYIWIENYGCFTNQEFNFSSMHEFKYNSPKQTLTYKKKNENYINIFNKESIKENDKIVNLTAIVGNNGCGKSTLLKIISTFLPYNSPKHGANLLIGFMNNNNKVLLYSTRDIRKIKVNETDRNQDIFDCKDGYVEVNRVYEPNETYIESQGEKYDTTTVCNVPELKTTRFIYYSNIFSYNDYTEKKHGEISDLSFSGIINQYYENTRRKNDEFLKKDKLINFINEETENQIKFICRYHNNNKIIPFKIPRKVEIKLKQDRTMIKELEQILLKYNFLKEKKSNNHLNIFYHINKDIDPDDSKFNNKHIFLHRFCICIINNLLFELILKPFVPNDTSKIVEIFSDCDVSDNDDFFEYCKELIITIKEKLNREKSVDELIVEPYLRLIKFIQNNYNNLDKQFFDVTSNSELALINLDECHERLFKHFYTLYKGTCFNYHYLSFSWNLSSGENTLLGMYSRFYSVLDRIKKVKNYYQTRDVECNNLIILIDEADLTLHPSWQQKFILPLIGFLTDIYKEQNIQLIIATHSPIILSDIPKSNVIFIKKENQEINVQDNDKHTETFGANISSLFYDSFFMNKGSIGELAKKQINDLIDALRPIEEDRNKEECTKLKYPSMESVIKKLQVDSEKKVTDIIDIIGEPIIKQKLKSMLNMCKYESKEQQKNKIMNDIKQLEQKLKKLDEE